MSLKQHGHFATNGFVFPLFRQMLQNTEKTTLNLWIVVNRIKCKRFLNSKPITRRRYIHTFIYERLFLACQTFQISNFTSEYRVLHTLDVAADNCLTGDFRLARPHWNNMARLSCHAKYPNPLQLYGWVICFEINCTWKQMSHRVMFAYRCWPEI